MVVEWTKEVRKERAGQDKKGKGSNKLDLTTYNSSAAPIWQNNVTHKRLNLQKVRYKISTKEKEKTNMQLSLSTQFFSLSTKSTLKQVASKRLF